MDQALRFRKLTGPIEHWLTTYHQGYWGFRPDKQEAWENIKLDDVFVFHASASELLELPRGALTDIETGIIGLGRVGAKSTKNEPVWWEELYRDGDYPYLIHFSEIYWFGGQCLVKERAVLGLVCMPHQKPLTVSLASSPFECWDEESTTSALRALVVRLHLTGISLRETAAVLEQFGVNRSHQAVFQWVHRVAEEVPDPPTASPSRVAVDETAVTIGTEQYWLYAAIDLDTKLLLGVRISDRRGTDPAAEFLGQLAEKHDLAETTVLVDDMGYLTALARCDLRGHLDYVDRNLIEKWFQTLSMRIDRFHQTWMGRRASAQRWLTAFVHYYNTQRPNQALDDRTPAEKVMN